LVVNCILLQAPQQDELNAVYIIKIERFITQLIIFKYWVVRLRRSRHRHECQRASWLRSEYLWLPRSL